MENPYYIFKKLRVDQNLTLLDVFGGTEIDPSSISKIENGKNRNPSFRIIKRLCSFFQHDINLINV